MDAAIFWLVIIGPILIGLAGCIWGYGGGRTPALWTGFAGTVLLMLAATLQGQQAIWKSQASVPTATTVTPAQTNPLDHTIGFQCAWSAPPSHYRDDKTLFIVDFQGVPNTGINPNQQVAGPSSFRRSSEPFKPSDHYSNDWYRCDITNHGTQAVRNLRAKFPVQFAEAETTQNGTQSGKIVASGYALTPSIDLGTGPAGSDYFYFANASAAFIQVDVPTTAVLQTLADDELHIVKLISPSFGKGAFSLIPSTNPLNVGLPAPAAGPMPPQTNSNSKENLGSPQPQIRPNQGIDLNQYSPKTCFDYSTNDGLVKLAFNAITFEIRFSKASDKSIHVYKDSTNLRAIANLKGVNPGDDVDFAAFDSSSRVYTVPLGGYFIAENVDGHFLLARILSIKDDTRGDSNDEVCFAYRIDTSKGGRFKAI